jgi:hypothetical protein
MGKKIQSEMMPPAPSFVEGAAKNNVEEARLVIFDKVASSRPRLTKPSAPTPWSLPDGLSEGQSSGRVLRRVDDLDMATPTSWNFRRAERLRPAAAARHQQSMAEFAVEDADGKKACATPWR